MPTAPRTGALIHCGLLLGLAATGCAPSGADPVRQYFSDYNTAARQGPAAQRDFLARTQHPDFTDQTCDLGDTTVELDPAMSTLRPDPAFSPDGAGPPRGEVWIIGVEVVLRRDGTVTGRQVGSQHVVVLDGRVHGFAPCPS